MDLLCNTLLFSLPLTGRSSIIIVLGKGVDELGGGLVDDSMPLSSSSNKVLMLRLVVQDNDQWHVDMTLSVNKSICFTYIPAKLSDAF